MSDPRDDRAPADQERDRNGNPEDSTNFRDTDGRDDSGPVETPVDTPDSSGAGEHGDRDSGSDSRVDRGREPDGLVDQSPREGQSTRQDEQNPPTRQDEHQPKTTRSDRSGPQAPPRKQGSTDGDGRWMRFLQYASDIASSVLIVVLIGALLFATSGVWPPLVAIESPSMEPHIDTGELVFVMDENRFAGPGAIGESGVVPARAGEQTGYRMFEGYGDVIIYEPDGNDEATPIIHRAMFWVENGENWYERADADAIGGADSCEELANCPAPHAGFITKGDNNRYYDQVGNPFSGPVKPAWVVGTAEYGVPGLGQVRLLSSEVRSENVTTTMNATNVSDDSSLPAVTP